MSKTNTRKKNKWSQLNLYYKRTGFYDYLWTNTKKALPSIIIFIIALVIVNKYVININELLVLLTKNHSDTTIFTVFFISESILGLLPPDIFIAWTNNTPTPIYYLFILSVLSFLGGVISYLYGRALLYNDRIREYMEVKASQHIGNMRKLGGFLIAVGALLPLPFAIACLAAGMINFSRKHFFMFALLRFGRFIIYGFLIYSALS